MSYTSITKALASGFSQFFIQDALDIAIITVLIYKLIVWTKETRAYEVLKGVGLLFLCSIVAQLFSLTILSWLLDSILTSGSIIIVLFILFQPEIRRVLEKLGRSGKRLGKGWFDSASVQNNALIRDMQTAILSLSHRRVGALIVIERGISLSDICDTGDYIDARINQRLIENIFFKNSPLHDGAMVITKKRIRAAGCILPVSHNQDIPKELGLRHRAAMGISQDSDAIAIVVSEETGRISVAIKGEFQLRLSAEQLESVLTKEMMPAT